MEEYVLKLKFIWPENKIDVDENISYFLFLFYSNCHNGKIE